MIDKGKSWKIVNVIDTVLLVEGDPASRNSMKFLLEVNGYRVVEASHGVEALRILDKCGDSIHLALCSTELPDMTGAEWLGQMRFLLPDLPVLLLTDGDWSESAGLSVDRLTGSLAAKMRLVEKIQTRLDERFFAPCNRASAA